MTTLPPGSTKLGLSYTSLAMAFCSMFSHHFTGTLACCEFGMLVQLSVSALVLDMVDSMLNMVDSMLLFTA